MGDVVHTLPALTDAAKAIPGLQFDWAVDEAFAQIPAWHSEVESVFPTALRRWGSNPAGREVRQFRNELRRQRYDFVVDLQGEFKSALIARLARGVRCGYNAASVHERGAQLTYRKKFGVPKGVHSLQRMRKLLSLALGYSYAEYDVDYSIERSRLQSSALEIPEPYVVFIHSTSWESKNWPETYWRELTARAINTGVRVVLPWGSEAEGKRAERIAGGDERAIVLPRLSISEKASIISRASATVGLDTGLSHIAAALGVPSVTLYGATDPNLCGTIGDHQFQIASDFECVKCHQERCSYEGRTGDDPACFADLGVERVWPRLENLIKKSYSRSRNIYQLA